MEGYMLSVGYPVGVNAQKQTYEIELKDRIVELTVEEMKVWVKAKTVDVKKLSKEEKDILEVLITKRVIAFDETIEGLFEQIKTLKIVRQGIVGIKNDKISILLGRDVVTVTKEQCLIWKYGDGNNTIEEVQDYIYPQLSLEKFLIYLISLMAGNLVWII